MSILSFNQVSLKLAEHVILQCADWQIQAKEKIALVGRNGAGKSTIIKLLQGEMTPDTGVIQKESNLRIAGLVQDVPNTQDETVYHFLVRELKELGQILAGYREACVQNHTDTMSAYEQKIDGLNAWDFLPRIESMANHLGLTIDAQMKQLSGGMKRRALLGAALIAEPDLLLLDEPTNHLDINAIEWLESYLAQYRGSLILVTHDRQFLSQVANRIVEIDRGKLYSHQCDYETYLDRREAIRLAEEKQNHLFDKRLMVEEAWIRQGVEARRTRNEGRVRRLKAMREAHNQRREQLGKIKQIDLQTSYSGKIVIEATAVNYSIKNNPLIKNLSLLLTRGDKIGIIGPNGCGKTTLIRLLLKELMPDSGSIRHGTALEIAYVDQLRSQLDENQTLMNNVADGADYVTINGQKKHVASYLREFLFSPERFNQPVFSLSGGERNRLLLAKLLAKPINLLIMDEPTNDLDIETLERLESMLTDYSGTLILISHDREFINHIVSSVLVYEDGQFNEYVGGYEAYRQLKKQKQQTNANPPISARKKSINSKKLSYHEQRELDELPERIETLETRIETMHQEMASTAFYQKSSESIVEFNTQLAALEATLKTLFTQWESLEHKKN